MNSAGHVLGHHWACARSSRVEWLELLAEEDSYEGSHLRSLWLAHSNFASKGQLQALWRELSSASEQPGPLYTRLSSGHLDFCMYNDRNV